MATIKPCGKVHKEHKSERDHTKKEVPKYVPKMKWSKSEMGTLINYSASNSRYRCVVSEGCFGRSTHVAKVGSMFKEDVKYYLFKDASVEELQEKMEKQYLW